MRLISRSWMRSAKSLLLVSLSALEVGCASGAFTIPEFNLNIERPANLDGYRVNVITGEAYIIPKEEWVKRRRRAIIIEREDWEIVKKALYTPCVQFECTQQLDTISSFFESVDAAIGGMP